MEREKPDDSVFDAIKTLAEKGVGALMVMEGGRLVGIFSDAITPEKLRSGAEFARNQGARHRDRQRAGGIAANTHAAVHGADERQENPPFAGGRWADHRRDDFHSRLDG